jgi:hypothetical protein
MVALEDLNREIEDARARRDEARELEDRLDRAWEALSRERLRESDHRRSGGERFVDSLLSLFGRRRDAVPAPVPGVVQELQAGYDEIRSRLAALGDPEREYEKLLERKEAALMRDGDRAGRLLIGLARERERIRKTAEELRETRQAGIGASSALERLLERLGTAGQWGIFDLIGGGLLATAFKHDRIHAANALAKEAMRRQARFLRALEEVEEDRESLKTELGEVLAVGDYLLGLPANWLVQTRIHDAERRVSIALGRTESLLGAVEARILAVEEDLREAEAARLDILRGG